MVTQPTSTLDSATRLGLRLRKARMVSGLTLKEVAERAGCSESFVSKIENGKAVPSLARLYSIVEATGATFGALFDGDCETPDIVMRAGTRPVISFGGEGQNTGNVVECLVPLGGDHLLEGYLITIPAQGTGAGTVQHKGEELGYVVEGQLELNIDGKSFRLQQGDSFQFRSELPHAYRNPSDRITRVIWINTPPTF